MSEEIRSEENSPGAPETSGLAMDLAMEEARSDPSLRDDVAAFLRNQNSLIDVQKHHLIKQFRLGLWEKRLGVFLRLATAVVGIAVATAVGSLVWDARRSNGLIVESFNVPPDMAAKGLSGDVVATQVLDKLTALQESTNSSRAPQSYANNWGDNIKVEIADTGVSIGEIQRFLKAWLGHDTHISGEVYRTATGIAVAARAGSETGASFTGAESDLDALVQKAAEHVYSRTQPYRYANYLDRNLDPVGKAERRARAAAIYEQLSLSPDPQERAWALNGLGTLAAGQSKTRVAIAYYSKSVEAWPDYSVGYFARGMQERFLDRRENMLAALRIASRLQHSSAAGHVHPKVLPTARATSDGQIAMLVGDFGEAVRQSRAVADMRVSFANLDYRGGQIFALFAMARQHDGVAIRGYLRDLGRTQIPTGAGFSMLTRGALEDWRGIAASMASVSKEVLAQIFARAPLAMAPAALAKAHLGDIKGAEALIATSPLDCDGCLIARAQIAEMRGQEARADAWFARAELNAPSIPFAYYEWGAALLKRGKPDNAIEKFEAANQKGPKFADPLEGWGEALMAKNQSHLAVKKFEEAEKYAPNWGRLHLKWGQALAYSGNKTEAAKHFARAATLDLNPSEKQELARMRQ